MKITQIDAGMDYLVEFSTGKVIKECCEGLNNYVPDRKDESFKELTEVEQLELADFMLCKWLAYKNEVQKKE